MVAPDRRGPIRKPAMAYLLLCLALADVRAYAQHNKKYLRLYNDTPLRSAPGFITYNEAFRNYFLCKCLAKGYKSDTVLYMDGAPGLYFELLSSVKPAVGTIDSLATATTGNITWSRYEGTLRGDVLAICLEEYNRLTPRIIRKISRSMKDY